MLMASLLCGVLSVSAQDYNSAIGLQGGLYNGVSFRTMISSDQAIEGIVSARYGGFRATLLYEIQHAFPSAQRLHWYYGGGAHIGTYNTGNYNKQLDGASTTSVFIGVDGIIGMEYNFDFPLNLSLDWKPSFNLIGYGTFIGDGFALSARYYF